jgi:hypothetical protein
VVKGSELSFEANPQLNTESGSFTAFLKLKDKNVT